MISLLFEFGLVTSNFDSFLKFPKNILNDLPESSWEPDSIEISNRIDIRKSHLVFSIDPPGCQDIDGIL